jgi:hypothetical protein
LRETLTNLASRERSFGVFALRTASRVDARSQRCKRVTTMSSRLSAPWTPFDKKRARPRPPRSRPAIGAARKPRQFSAPPAIAVGRARR